ncbi:MAG: sugar nucleotide-binding protein [Bacteroidia bacterium]|nr:sugar nucleotide-binding protein [Bacteroidia bacterium]
MNTIKRPIVFLGHKGMLGQMAVKYFTEKGYTLHTTDIKFTPELKDGFMRFILQYPEATVINAIGKINQKTTDYHELLWANTILPLELNNRLLPTQLLIHPSTDCVFSGKKGMPYTITDVPDPIDAYGWSKRLGEVALQNRPNTIITRVSIIGPDKSPQPKGLLGWFLSQPEGSTLKGFTNHIWNGITTLEWCKQVEQLIKINDYEERSCLFQLGTSEFYTKHEMLLLFSSILNKKISIEKFATHEGVDRRLQPGIITESLEIQLENLKNGN